MTHVVSTFYWTGKGKIVTHAYGPMTQTEARAMQNRLRRDERRAIDDGALYVSVNKLLTAEGKS